MSTESVSIPLKITFLYKKNSGVQTAPKLLATSWDCNLRRANSISSVMCIAISSNSHL